MWYFTVKSVCWYIRVVVVEVMMSEKPYFAAPCTCGYILHMFDQRKYMRLCILSGKYDMTMLGSVNISVLAFSETVSYWYPVWPKNVRIYSVLNGR